MRPRSVLLAGAGTLAALTLSVGAVTGAAAASQGPDVSLRSIACSPAVGASAGQLSLLSDAVPADIGSRVCRLLGALDTDLG